MALCHSAMPPFFASFRFDSRVAYDLRPFYNFIAHVLRELVRSFSRGFGTECGKPFLQFGQYVRDEIIKWAKVVKDSGAKLD